MSQVTLLKFPESHSTNFGSAISSHEIELCFWKCFQNSQGIFPHLCN